MAQQELVTQSHTDRLLDHIETLHAQDLTDFESIPGLTEIQQSRTLPFAIVLSAAALRAEGLSVSQATEKRVVKGLGVSRGTWIDAVTDIYSTLRTEVAEGDVSASLSVALGEDALNTVRKRPPVGFYSVKAVVELAARQEDALNNQAGIALGNIAVQAQL